MNNNDLQKKYIIAIDGRAASGKTYLSGELSKLFNAPVIHLDDFFLPLDLRTAERYGQPGGNVHYERFALEVIPHLRENKEFSYQRFDCQTKSLADYIKIENSRVIIIEGSYSHHPYFGDYADLKIFKTVSKEVQWQRILERNGEKWGQDFKNKWIPLEEEYFKSYDIESKADIILCDNGDGSV